MPELILTAQPGFTEVQDSAFDAGNPATADNMKALNANAKFAAVRDEQFWGFYRNGEQVGLPVSPIDGYQYERAELRYTCSWYWTGAAPGPLNGVQYVGGNPPAGGPSGGAGHVLNMLAHVGQDTGLVLTAVIYHVHNGAQTNTGDGILMVMTHAQRLRNQ